MLPKNDWWAVIAAYNERIFPMQWIGLGVFIVLVLYLIWGEQKRANLLIKLTLGVSNLWIGVGFFVMSDGFPLLLRTSQGFLFIAIGVLTLLDIKANKFVFQYPTKGLLQVFFIIAMILMLLYPFVGALQQKDMNQWIIQGTLPCPTTAYFLILIITAQKRTGKLLYILLLFWAIPFPPLIQIPQYGVYEDGIMFIMGLIGFILLLKDLVSEKKKKAVSEVAL